MFVVEPESGHAGIRETHKLEGENLTLESMRAYYLSMEGWSQMVFDDLAAGATSRAKRDSLVVALAPAP